MALELIFPKEELAVTTPRQDPFALPRIDQIIDSTAGSELLCFLNAYSGYHQIRLKKEDELKTSFITPLEHFVT